MKRAISVLLCLLVFATQACRAADTSPLAESTAGKNVSSSLDASPDSKPAKFVEGHKVDGNKYVPILYQIKLSKNDELCGSLLAAVNKDLALSPYVDYGNAESFQPWELIEGGHDAGGIKYFRNKEWFRKFRPPVAKASVDIDNDGDHEYLYLLTHRQVGPLPRQHLFVFNDLPEVEIKTTEDPADQSSIFWEYAKKQKQASNLAGEVAFYQPLWLAELPEYSAKDPIGFRGEVAAFFVFKHDKKNYLVADTLNYDPQSKYWYRTNPWLVLFSVSSDVKLTNMCILKRTK